MNNFAIDSKGIGDALQRSASALVEGGNSIDEAIALVTASNSVIQNPDQVGTALKTLSLRLRSTKIELEDMGEDAEGAATSTAKLREQLLGLTGGKVDIMLNETTFKNTTQILREMAAVWDEMDDISRAGALELIGGKRQANILSSLITNFETVEQVIKTSANSAGSALAENQKYIESIQGHIDVFNNSLQTFWNNFIDSGMIKGVVDLGTLIFDFFNKIGAGFTTLIGIMGGAAITTLFKGFDAWFKDTTGDVKLVQSLTNSFGGLKNGIVGVGKALSGLAASHPVLLAIAATLAAVTAVTIGVKNAEKEAAAAANEHAQEVKEENNALEGYKKKAISLRKELDSGNLSEQEAYDVRKQLIGIQDELIDRYGKEAKGINVVTGAIESQIDALDQLAIKNAQNWLNENSKKKGFLDDSAIEQAIEAIETQYESYDVYGTNVWNNVFKDAYDSDWQQYSKDAAQEYQDFIESLGGKLNLESNAIHFEDVTREQIDDYYTQIQNWLREYGKDNNLDFNTLIGKIERDKQERLGEDYQTHKANYDAYLENTAIASYTDAYGKILDAENEFLKASTDKDKLSKLNEHAQSVAEAFKEAGGTIGTDGAFVINEDKGNASMQKYFAKMQEKFAEEEFELNVKLNVNNLKTDLQKIIKADGERGLSALDDIAIKDMIKRGLNVEGAIDESGAYTAEQIAGLIQLQAEANAAGVSIESLIGTLVNLGLIAGQPVTGVVESIQNIGKAYSTLATAVEQHTNINQVLNEVSHDNIEISEEQYNMLQELVGAEEAFTECIDTENGYIVKNAALLRKLVDQKKQAQKATIQEVKAHSQLQYKNTVQQIQKLVSTMGQEYKAQGFVSNATLNHVDLLRSQLKELKQTTQQYTLLELQLTEAAGAYTEFELAKERDAKLSYGDSMVEMLDMLNEGFKTGQLGTEAIQVAVETIVPDSVYKDIDDLEERWKAIHDYIDKETKFADYFTIDDGEISITMDNIKAFIADCEESKLFTQADENGIFSLSADVNSLKDFADALGVTESVALAMLSEMEKYDANWGNVLTDLTTHPLDKPIIKATEALDDALSKQEAFIKSGDPLYNDDGSLTEGYKSVCENVDKAVDKLDAATAAQQRQVQVGAAVQTMYKALANEISLTQEQADYLARTLGMVDKNGQPTVKVNDDGSITTTADAISKLNQQAQSLGDDPTIMQVQLRYDTIDERMKELQKYIDDNSYTSEILTTLEINNVEEAEAYLEELTKERDTIQLTYNITETTEEKNTGTIEKLTQWEVDGVTITIKGNTEEFDKTKEEIDNTELEDKSVGVTVSGYNTAVKNLDAVASAIDDIESKTVTITVNTVSSDSTKTTKPKAKSTGAGHVLGTAFTDGNWGAPRTESALVGELGPEMRVRDGRWELIGEHGAEFSDVKKGDIIFNHKQTEQLLNNGHITGRGKAYASGTAYEYGIVDSYVGDGDAFKDGSKSWVDAGENVSDAADEAKDVIDFIEIKIAEIEASISKTTAQIANFVDDTSKLNDKNTKYDALVDEEKEKEQAYRDAQEFYSGRASAILKNIPKEYQKMAQNGAIAVKDFVGENETELADLINEYREWDTKADEAEIGWLESIAQQAAYRIEQLEDIASDYDNLVNYVGSQSDIIEAEMSLMEEFGAIQSPDDYKALIDNSLKQIGFLKNKKADLEAALTDAVNKGDIIVGSDEWYEAKSIISDVDQEIIQCREDIVSFANAMENLRWDALDRLMTRLESIDSQLSHLFDRFTDGDVVDEAGNWTSKGIAALGVSFQKMESAKTQAQKYASEIEQLDADFAAGLYAGREEVYYEKREELTEKHWEAIEALEAEKDAIIELNKERVEAIKKGIDEEIDAYKELIAAKKEALDADKDSRDFERSVQDKQKEIDKIDRKIAALAGDNSASAAAQRKKLQEERAELQADLDDLYYDRSIENQKDAFDQSAEEFENAKEEEKEALDKYLEDEEKVISDSLNVVKSNTATVLSEIQGISSQYGVSIASEITKPWTEGQSAISNFSQSFTTFAEEFDVSTFTEELQKIVKKYEDIESAAREAAEVAFGMIGGDPSGIGNTGSNPPKDDPPKTDPPTADSPTTQEPAKEPEYETYTIKKGDNLWNLADEYLGSGAKYKDIYNVNKDVIKDPNKVYVGQTIKIPKYAKGTTGVKNDEFAWIDEIGEELVLHADGSGKLAYLTKGSSVIPSDLTQKLLDLAVDPTQTLENSRPIISAPQITNNEININMEFGEVVHIDTVTNDTIPDLTKAIEKQMDKYMKGLNNQIRKYTR